MWGWLASLLGSGAGQAAAGSTASGAGGGMMNLGMGPGSGGVMGGSSSTPGGFGSITQGGAPAGPAAEQPGMADIAAQADIGEADIQPNITPDMSQRFSSPSTLFAMANQMQGRPGGRRQTTTLTNPYLRSLMGG